MNLRCSPALHPIGEDRAREVAEQHDASFLSILPRTPDYGDRQCGNRCDRQ